MVESILNAVKKQLGIPVEDTAFDADVLLLINAEIARLRQLGVGPEDPILVVNKDTEWSTLTTNETIQAMAKSLVFMSVKVAFDPPGTSFLLDSYKQMIQETIWRIEVEANPYVPPTIIIVED